MLSRYSADYGNLISRRQSEQALRAAAVESALASRAKSQFLANMSHELRTPLNAIIGFSDLIKNLIKEDHTNSKTREYADHIHYAGHHLLAIISDILDMSRIESGAFELDLALHSIKEAIEAAISIMEPRIAEKCQRLCCVLADDIPVIGFDRRRIIQVVLNLLSNATKFTPPAGQISITVEVTNVSLIVTVTDTGIGMNPDQLDQALKPFGQVESAYSRDHQGTGLGLPLSKALVEQHQGKFYIRSEPQVGTSVAFTLPRLQAIEPARVTLVQPSPANVPLGGAAL
jgi:two-component system cell cycle sensor histidine kinase PleC